MGACSLLFCEENARLQWHIEKSPIHPGMVQRFAPGDYDVKELKARGTGKRGCTDGR